MPLVIHPRVRKAVGRMAASTVVTMLASTGAALAACPSQPTSSPFAQFGDNSSYFLAPGGSFEDGSHSGWWTYNAELVAGNEPWDVSESTDSQSMEIDSGGVATSPTFCVDSTMPDFRFFAAQDAPGSNLKVQLVIRDGDSDWAGSSVDTVTELSDGSASSWTAVSPVELSSGLNVPADGSVQAALRFHVTRGGGSWRIDDLYIDPYRAG